MFIDIGRTLEPVMALQSYMLYEANTQTHMYFRSIDPLQVSWQLNSNIFSRELFFPPSAAWGGDLGVGR